MYVSVNLDINSKWTLLHSLLSSTDEEFVCQFNILNHIPIGLVMHGKDNMFIWKTKTKLHKSNWTSYLQNPHLHQTEVFLYHTQGATAYNQSTLNITNMGLHYTKFEPFCIQMHFTGSYVYLTPYHIHKYM